MCSDGTLWATAIMLSQELSFVRILVPFGDCGPQFWPPFVRLEHTPGRAQNMSPRVTPALQANATVFVCRLLSQMGLLKSYVFPPLKRKLGRKVRVRVRGGSSKSRETATVSVDKDLAHGIF